MLLILLIHLSYLGVGLSAIRLIFGNQENTDALRLLLGYFTGVFIHVTLIHVSIIAKITSPLTSWSLVLVGLTALIIEVSYAIKTKTAAFKVHYEFNKKFFLNLGLLILLLPVICLITLKLVGLPDVSYDSTCFWNLKSKLFFYGQNLWTDAFQDTNRSHSHPGYPLYMPIVIFEHFSMLGVADDWLTKYGTWIYYSSGMILFYILIRQWTNHTIALLSMLLLLYSPLYSFKSGGGSITTTYLDFPLSLAIAASAGLFIRYQVYKIPLDIFGACVFVASAVLLKREGTAWFGLFVTFSLAAMTFDKKRHHSNDYFWLVLPLLTFAFWKIISSQLPSESDMARPTLEQLYKLGNVFPKMFRAWIVSCFDFKFWGLLPIFVIPYFTIGMLRNIRKPSILSAGFMVIGYLATILFTMMLIDVQTGLFDYYMLRTYPRLIMHLLPVSLFLAIVMNSSEHTRRLEIASI